MFEEWRAGFPGRDIRLVLGTWQEVMDRLGKFDGILFDAYPLNALEYAERLSSRLSSGVFLRCRTASGRRWSIHLLESVKLHQDALRYLERLQLDRKVQVEHGRSTLALSQGQRKRLALLTAYLEDRSIYVFDEWAADQDPSFKQVFYLEFLPELRRRGKTIFVISHDDHYFHVADRIVKLNYGHSMGPTGQLRRAQSEGSTPDAGDLGRCGSLALHAPPQRPVGAGARSSMAGKAGGGAPRT